MQRAARIITWLSFLSPFGGRARSVTRSCFRRAFLFVVVFAIKLIISVIPSFAAFTVRFSYLFFHTPRRRVYRRRCHRLHRWRRRRLLGQGWFPFVVRLHAPSSLRTNHRKYLDRIKFAPDLRKTLQKVTRVKACSQRRGVRKVVGRLQSTPHRPFVDNDIYADIWDVVRMEQAIAASIKAIFILLGVSGKTRQIRVCSRIHNITSSMFLCCQN